MAPKAPIVVLTLAALAAASTGVAVAATHGPSDHSTSAVVAANMTRSSVPITATGRSSKEPTCAASQLSTKLAGAGGAVGHGGAVVVLTNSSASGCSLSGYPGVSLTAPTGRTEAVTVDDASGPGFLFPAEPERQVSLDPEEQASFWVEWMNGSGTSSGSLAVHLPRGGVLTTHDPGTDDVGKVVVSPIVHGVIDTAPLGGGQLVGNSKGGGAPSMG